MMFDIPMELVLINDNTISDLSILSDLNIQKMLKLMIPGIMKLFPLAEVPIPGRSFFELQNDQSF